MPGLPAYLVQRGHAGLDFAPDQTLFKSILNAGASPDAAASPQGLKMLLQRFKRDDFARLAKPAQRDFSPAIDSCS